MVSIKQDLSNYPLERSVREHLEASGYRLKWIANQLGVNPQRFSQMLCGYGPIPLKYWPKLLPFLNGHITLQQVLAEKLKDIPDLKIEQGQDALSAHISLRRCEE